MSQQYEPGYDPDAYGDIPEGGAHEMHCVDALTKECEQLRKDKAELLEALGKAVRYLESTGQGVMGMGGPKLRTWRAAREAIHKAKGTS